MKSLALVIPCKNEAKRLLANEFLKAIEEYNYLSLLFVDDGSTDDTPQKIAALEKKSKSIKGLYLDRNAGKAEAVRQGVKWLLANTSCEAIGFWDADLATPLSELPAFCNALEKESAAQLAIGSRWPHLGARIDRSSFRSFTGSIMKMMINLALRLPVYDTQCGAKIFRREIASQVFDRPFVSRWLFDVELLKRIPKATLLKGAVEVPLYSWHDVPGSKLRPRDFFRQIYDLTRIALL